MSLLDRIYDSQGRFDCYDGEDGVLCSQTFFAALRYAGYSKSGMSFLMKALTNIDESLEDAAARHQECRSLVIAFFNLDHHGGRYRGREHWDIIRQGMWEAFRHKNSKFPLHACQVEKLDGSALFCYISDEFFGYPRYLEHYVPDSGNRHFDAYEDYMSERLGIPDVGGFCDLAHLESGGATYENMDISDFWGELGIAICDRYEGQGFGCECFNNSSEVAHLLGAGMLSEFCGVVLEW